MNSDKKTSSYPSPKKPPRKPSPRALLLAAAAAARLTFLCSRPALATLVAKAKHLQPVCISWLFPLLAQMDLDEESSIRIVLALDAYVSCSSLPLMQGARIQSSGNFLQSSIIGAKQKHFGGLGMLQQRMRWAIAVVSILR